MRNVGIILPTSQHIVCDDTLGGKYFAPVPIVL